MQIAQRHKGLEARSIKLSDEGQPQTGAQRCQFGSGSITAEEVRNLQRVSVIQGLATNDGIENPLTQCLELAQANRDCRTGAGGPSLISSIFLKGHLRRRPLTVPRPKVDPLWLTAF